MKILNADQIRDIDRYTVFEEGIPEIELMEKAASAFVECFQKKITIIIFLSLQAPKIMEEMGWQ